MKFYDIFLPALISAAIISPFVIVAILVAARDKRTAKIWHRSRGTVANVVRVSGEVDKDVPTISYIYEGRKYEIEYRNFKQISFSIGSTVELLVNPDSPNQINIVAPGYAKGVALFFLFVYLVFFVAIFLDKNYGSHPW